jgi:hypothetical protein
MVESQPSKLLVAGPIPVSRSKISIAYGVFCGAPHTVQAFFQFTMASSF